MQFGFIIMIFYHRSEMWYTIDGFYPTESHFLIFGGRSPQFVNAAVGQHMVGLTLKFGKYIVKNTADQSSISESVSVTN